MLHHTERVPHSALAGDEMQTVVLAPGACEDTIFVCPEDYQSATFACSAPNTRRFDYLFGFMSQPRDLFTQVVTIAAQQRARTMAIMYESEDQLTSSMMQTVRTHAQSLGISIVADVGVALDQDSPAIFRNELTKRWSSQMTVSEDVLKAQIKSSGTWQQSVAPFVDLVNQLDVDVVVGGTSYDSCVALVRAFFDRQVLCNMP